jgi:hypothetical protein
MRFCQGGEPNHLSHDLKTGDQGKHKRRALRSKIAIERRSQGPRVDESVGDS